MDDPLTKKHKSTTLIIFCTKKVATKDLPALLDYKTLKIGRKWFALREGEIFNERKV